jgi:hypothetical protein
VEEAVGEEDGADMQARAASDSEEGRGGGCLAGLVRAGPANGGGGRCVRACRPGWKSSRPNGPLGPEGERGKENKFYFSNLILQIQFSNVFEYLLNFDSNQSSQKYLCNSMHV